MNITPVVSPEITQLLVAVVGIQEDIRAERANLPDPRRATCDHDRDDIRLRAATLDGRDRGLSTAASQVRNVAGRLGAYEDIGARLRRIEAAYVARLAALEIEHPVRDFPPADNRHFRIPLLFKEVEVALAYVRDGGTPDHAYGYDPQSPLGDAFRAEGLDLQNYIPINQLYDHDREQYNASGERKKDHESGLPLVIRYPGLIAEWRKKLDIELAAIYSLAPELRPAPAAAKRKQAA